MCTTGPLLHSIPDYFGSCRNLNVYQIQFPFALVLLTHHISFLFGSCQAPMLSYYGYGFICSRCLPSSTFLHFFLARVSQFLSDSYKLSSYRVITLLRFSQLISKTLTRLTTVQCLNLYVLVYKPVVKIIVASALISFVI